MKAEKSPESPVNPAFKSLKTERPSILVLKKYGIRNMGLSSEHIFLFI